MTIVEAISQPSGVGPGKVNVHRRAQHTYIHTW